MPVGVSLGIIGLVLATAIVASLAFPKEAAAQHPSMQPGAAPSDLKAPNDSPSAD